MAEKRFTLIGSFTDNISPKLKGINKALKGIEKSITSFDKLGKKGGLRDVLKGANTEASNLRSTLVGVGKIKLEGIVRGLRSANKEMATLDKRLSSLSGKEFKSGITAAIKEVQVLGKTIDSVASKGFHFDRSGLEAATQDVRALGKEIDHTAQRGFQFDRSGLQAAQQDARVLGEILKANALIQVGQGVVGAGGAGVRAGMGAIGRIAAFTRARFQEAANDQLQDIQSRGSLFGSLNKEQMFANAKNIKDEKELAKLNEQNYDTTRAISRSMESAIADVVKNSTVSTTTITTLSRQLSDNLLPSFLKAKQVTDLSQFGGPGGREALDKLMGGEKGVGKELATVYEQIGSIISTPSYAPMAAMGFTQFIGQGTINRQLQIFEQNPVLVDAMKKYAAEFENSVDGRIKALKKALEVAMPEAALQEARTTITGGVQAIGDNLTNATAGILSMGAEIANQGKKTLEMAKRTGVIDKQVEAFERRQKEQRIIWAKERTRTDKEWSERAKMEREQVRKFTRGLVRMYENADSPIEIIAASFGPLMQKFADLLGSAGNLFINPVTAVMERLQLPLAQMLDSLDALASDVRGGKRSFAEAIGRALGEFFKAIATLFDPGGVADQGGSALQQIFKDFIKGFESIDGQKYLDMVLEGLKDLFMKAIFNEGNVMKGLTPLGDGLLKVFALLSAPAFIGALVNAMLPIILLGMGDLLKGFFSKALVKLKGGVRLPGLDASAAAAGGGGAGFFTRQAQKSASLGSKIPGVGGVVSAGKVLAGGAKMKGLGLLAAAVISLSTQAPTLAKAGKSIVAIGRNIPGLSIAFGALDFAARKASGEGTATAAGGAVGGVLGGSIGAAIGSIIPGVGTLIGGVLGTMLGSWLGSNLPSLLSPIGPKIGNATKVVASWFSKLPARLASLFGSIPGAVTSFLVSLPKRILFAVGVMIGLTLNAWDLIVKLVKVTLPNLLKSAVHSCVSLLTGAWKTLYNFCTVTAPNAWSQGISLLTAYLRVSFSKLLSFITSLPGKIGASVSNFISSGGGWASKVLNALLGVGSAIVDWARSLPGRVWSAITGMAGQVRAGTESVRPSGRTSRRSPRTARFSGAMGDAVAAELRKKPPGSDLVIANSSETIIPAAGGNSGTGMLSFVIELRNGFAMVARAVVANTQTLKSVQSQGISTIHSAVKSLSSANKASLSRVNDTLVKNQNQTNVRLAKLESKFSTPGLGGAMPSGGGVDAFNPLASQFGLTLTSGFRPGDPGWHGANRARDYSNGTGPTPQMMQFAKFLASNYGSRLRELIYTPLGFSIKNGRKVPPIAAGTHYNHVHVAYAFGPGGPAFFSSKEQAQTWERKMAPTNASISTVTANSSEGFGTNKTLHMPITIYQQPYQDAEQLASLVAMKLSMAIDELENHI